MIIAYIMLLLQCSLWKVLTVHVPLPGPFGVDLMLILAVFVFLHASEPIDGILGGTIIGFMWDIGMGGYYVGPMALVCAFCGWWIIGIREALFRNRALPQMVLTMLFVFFSHLFWITLQSLRGAGATGWGDYAGMLLSALLVAVVTSLLTPLVVTCLMPLKKMIVTPPLSPANRRSRRR